MSALTRTPRDPVDAQRLDALRKGHEHRTARAAMKRAIQAGRTNAWRIALDPPEYALTMSVEELLKAIPQFGGVKTRRVLGKLAITSTRRLEDLTDRQRRLLSAELEGASKGAGHEGVKTTPTRPPALATAGFTEGNGA